MHSVGFYSAAVVAALAVSSAQAHMHHHAQAHTMRGLQMADGSMGMDMTSASSTASSSTSTMDMTSSTDSDSTMDMTSPMSMSMDMTSSSTADGDFKCPVCGMSTMGNGYDNENHVGMVNGQMVYTCGMAARTFDDYGDMKLTDTAYLAANMAEFIVNSTDADAFAKCTDSCDECADGISDPVTGDKVTTSNYEYVCLKNGQKIYFSSTDSKNKYLSNVNSEPRYLVDSIICEEETCPDAKNVTTLSAAAQAFVADLSSSSDSGSATITASGSGSSAASGVQMPAGVTLAMAGMLAAITAMAA